MGCLKMTSAIMMQSMCNNQINDLGMYGSQLNQVNYGSTQFDATFATSPAVSPDFAGGAMFVNNPPQTLAMPPMSFPAPVSPQILPMGYTAISPPPMVPVMDVNPLGTGTIEYPITGTPVAEMP